MASLVERYWEPSFEAGLPRRERRGCRYAAYIPDSVSGRTWSLAGDVAADVADAEAAITRLNVEASALADSEALARLLLRAEAVASSRIEGLEVGGRRLLRAEAARSLGEEHFDVTAEEVLANINAMSWAVSSIAPGDAITLDTLLEVHRRLLSGTRLQELGGVVRTDQNWIGGSRFNPCDAAFVPPPPEEVGRLLEDLCAFCNEDQLPGVMQAAIAHAQFETIHPFADGNGRTGRALIHIVLRRRALAPRVLPPVSLILATWADQYVAALNGTRYVGDAAEPQAQEGLAAWVALFAAACRRAVGDAAAYEARVAGLQGEWRLRLGRVRSGSAADLVLAALPGMPVLTVSSAAQRIGRTFQATNQAVGRLTEAKVLLPVHVGRRNRAFEAAELVDTFVDLERRLASATGDTRSSPPVRPAPRRPQRT